MRTGELGFWWRSLGGPPPAARRRWRGPTEADVAIVGAGYTGLWSRLLPEAGRVRRCGSSCSSASSPASAPRGATAAGCLASSPGPARAYERRAGRRGATRALQRAMFETVDEIARSPRRARHRRRLRQGRACSRVALGRARRRARLREQVADGRAHGLRRGGPARALDARSCASGCASRGARARASPRTSRACTPPSCSPGSPQRSSGSASRSTSGRPSARFARTRRSPPRAAVRARWVVRATEGYTAVAARPAARARADEQLDDRHRAAAGRQRGRRSAGPGARCSATSAHVYVYLQRTADGRIAIGGRGVPYRFGSRTDGAATRPRRPSRACARSCASMFPAAAERRARARVVGRARRAARLVRVGRRRPRLGLAWAGGYVGEGVAAANLAARTLRDLMLGEHERAHGARRGSGARRDAGSPSRCAGRRSARLLALPPRRPDRGAQRAALAPGTAGRCAVRSRVSASTL